MAGLNRKLTSADFGSEMGARETWPGVGARGHVCRWQLLIWPAPSYLG